MKRPRDLRVRRSGFAPDCGGLVSIADRMSAASET
jgi:hypothetical protein